MFVQSLLDAFSKFVPANRLIQGVAALMLGRVTLWWIAKQAGPVQGTVLVHVTESDVVVTVGGHTVSIAERQFSPLEYLVRPGRYLLQMRRGDRILYEEWLIVRRGEEVILTAYCPR
jgi:hypothetical protein